jgi:hypothetical protein
MRRDDPMACKTLKSFKLSCPLCGAIESIKLDLNDLTTCSCGECGDEFGPEDARKRMAEQLLRWDAVCAWIAMAGDCLAGSDGDTRTKEVD